MVAVPDEMTSASMLDIRNAVASLTARRRLPGSAHSSRPSESSTREMRCGATAVPSLANTPYADVSSINVTSPVPSASDGTFGIGDAIPRRCARYVVELMPTCCSSCAAARLLEIFSAARSVYSVCSCSPLGSHAPRDV